MPGLLCGHCMDEPCSCVEPGFQFADNTERPCEPRCSNEDAEDWCAVAQWETEKREAAESEVRRLKALLEIHMKRGE